jgi:hypothetical protein
MPYPLEDAGFTLWCSDIETRLMSLYRSTPKDMGFDRRALQQRYYAGESVFTFLDSIEAR